VDEQKSHPPCPHGFFFFTSSLPQNFPASYLPPTSPSPPYSIAKALEPSSESELETGAMAGARECLELELLEPGSCG